MAEHNANETGSLPYLSKADREGRPYALDHYPATYRDHPYLMKLGREASCDHAEALFEDGFEDGIETAVNQLGEEEIVRLCDLALAGARTRRRRDA